MIDMEIIWRVISCGGEVEEKVQGLKSIVDRDNTDREMLRIV